MRQAIPKHLTTNRAEGLIRGEAIAQYELGSMRNFVYLVIDWEMKEALIVDPQKDLAPLEDLQANGIALKGILITHSHHDHIAGVSPLLEIDPSLPVYVHPLDEHRLKKISNSSLHLLTDGERFYLNGEKTGTGVEIETLHSPGHSAGEVCFVVRVPDGSGYLLSGDTLFIRDCGRTDLETGNNEAMFATLQKLKSLPDSYVMLPGHHYALETANLLGVEKTTSPPLLCLSVEELRTLP